LEKKGAKSRLNELEVIKLGGSILRNKEAFEHAANIVEEKISQSKLPICVVSAMNGVTDKIIEAVEKCHTLPEYDPKKPLKSLYDSHIQSLPFGYDTSPELIKDFDKLFNVLAYINSSGELTDSVYAYAISRGENFSTRILSLHLEKKGINNICFYGEDLMITDENFREASVHPDKTRYSIDTKLKKYLEKGIIPIIAGFAGRSVSGRVTIFGRGGTDDTAVNIAYGLGVKRAIKYVNEQGIMNIDPKFIEDIRSNHRGIWKKLEELPKPEAIPYISYVEASELLREGRTKVVHYKVLTPLMKGNIELHIKNFSDLESEGTIIGRVEETFFDSKKPRPKAISYQRNLYGVKFLPTQSTTPSEVYAKVFSRLAQEKIDIRYLSTSGYQMSFLMPKNDLEKAINILKTLDIADEVSPLKGQKGTFSVIGSEMRGMRGFFSRLTGILARHGVNIEQATQPNTENIIRFSLDDNDIPLAVSAVYKEFFNGGINLG
jgi:aspartokinase